MDSLAVFDGLERMVFGVHLVHPVRGGHRGHVQAPRKIPRAPRSSAAGADSRGDVRWRDG